MGDDLVTADRLVTVFGGSGFIGRNVVRALARRGWRIRVAARRPDLAFHLQPLGVVGQIHAVQANLRYPESIVQALRDAQAAINLVGILHQSGDQQFEAIHHIGAENVAKAAKQAGLDILVQMSAIGANPSAASVYAQTKAFGEAAVRQLLPDAIIMRPSVVFGPEDQFFNRFAAMARVMPALPLVGGGETKFQPVFVGDVADAIALAAEGKAIPGTIYELGGPEIATLRQVITFVLAVTGRRRRLVSLSFESANYIALVTDTMRKLSLGLFPETFTISADQVKLLRADNIVSPLAESEGRTLRGLGITPQPFETLAPSYLYRYRKTGQFAGTRAV
ncbi:MAG: complex I NDUFA9 subunit family protein [Beijerinckiaceae bacterium]|nr:complex I NDUFA9 subunit family protein [Beijerinckiaceae bacterium]MCI0599722.1 complex I NDUFA9 subunit family protein [Beijerinckiaceae bacterium]MCI0735240.1 complex I NDUFA9 subunit family protein [Beijerinckiaceae bacterium]